jgi:hypothetical protein
MSEFCSICHCDDIKDTITTACNHKFHESCLNEWLNIKANCPLCRHALEPRFIPPPLMRAKAFYIRSELARELFANSSVHIHIHDLYSTPVIRRII